MHDVVAPQARRPAPAAVGIGVWLASEVMFFAGLFAAYFSLRAANPVWPPSDVELATVRAGVFTAMLVASSATLHRADVAADHGDERRARSWTAATLALGAVFLAGQGLEWQTAGFHVGTHSYGTIFYALTGFHGLHVAIGLALLAVLIARPASWSGSTPNLRRGVSWYWHFVDVVWVGLFVTIFLVR